MKQIIFLITLLVVTNALRAQQLTGKVTDALTGESIPGVNIYLPEIKKGVISQVDGYYELNFPRKGSYKVQFSFVGYDIVLRTVEVADQPVTFDVQLHPSVIETKEFVISSVYQSSQPEHPVEVIQFDAAQLNQSPEPTLMQSLSSIAGVSVISSGVGNSKPVIRGLSNNRVLVYSQGMPFDNQQWGDDHSLGLNGLGIDKVEVIKGPSSLLYGADAMGGVLHFVAEKPAPVKTIRAAVGSKYFSNTDGYANTFGIKATREHVRVGLYAGHVMHSDYKQSADIFDKDHLRVTNTRFNERALRANLGFITRPWVTDITYSFNQAAIGIPEEPSFQNLDKDVMLPYQLTTSNVISMENSFFFGDSKITLNVGFQNNDRKEFEDEHAHESAAVHGTHADEGPEYLKQQLVYSMQDTGALDLNLKTYNYDVKWFLPSFKKLDVVLGAQGKHQINRNKGEEILIPDADVMQAGVFSLFKYNLKKVNILSGIRYDVKSILTYDTDAPDHGAVDHVHEETVPVDRSFGAVNGSFGVTYQLDSTWLLRTNIATGFRAPNLAELTSNGVHHGALRYELGDPNLTTENNIELDLGIEMSSEHVSLVVSPFYNHINHFIYLNPQDSVVDGVQLFTYEQTDANLYGFEATLDIHPHVMHWLHFETQYAMVIGKKSDGSYLPRIPANNLLNTLKAELEDFKMIKKPYLSVALNTLFEQNQIDVYETPTLTYVLLNASVGAELMIGKQPLELNIGVTNLLDRKYFNHLSRLKQQGIYDMGRNVVVGLRIPIQVKG
ncbi:MAG: TonB-dependent receptor [Flavobacteriales bacterium]|nr:TonB-dependent receptor [Flavobacteriales bacterium]